MDLLDEARAARARHDWGGCADAVGAVTFLPDDPAAEAQRLELLADASWWLGRLDACIEAREQAYVLYDELREDRHAGRCAVWLYEHHCFRASPSIAGGWLRRARRALDTDEACAEFGSLVLREAEVAHGSGDLEAAAAHAELGIELGRRLRSSDLEAEALQTLGRVRIDQCRPR